MKQFYIPAAAALLLWCIFLTLFFTSTLCAQKTGARVITGKITGGFAGLVVPGATIAVKGTKNAVASGGDGAFSIFAQTGDVLVISSIGYKTREITVKEADAALPNIMLEEDYSTLQTVVVVGYGRMKKTDLSSAVVTIVAKELDKTTNVTLDEALQGKAANVYVTQTSGQPGAGASVIIRGISTISGNYQPLYVIDGVQIRPSVPTGGAFYQPAGYANELAGINPDDVESISVLEGAAATSIYGAAGANGVLMITTKHGKKGQTNISASTLVTNQQAPKQLPVMNLKQYGLYVQKLAALGLVDIEPSELNEPALLGKGTNWQAALLRPTKLQKQSLAISGGTDQSTFYFSADYLNQDGVALGSGFQRASMRINMDNQATKWFKFGINLSGFTTKEKVNTLNGDLINIAITQNPTIPVKNLDGSWGGPAQGQAQYSQTNPVAVAELDNNYNTTFGGVGGFYMDITPFKGLVWRTEANGNITVTNNYTFAPSYTVGSYVNPNTQGSRASANNYWGGLNTTLQYNFAVKKHSVTAMIGHEGSLYAYQGLSGSGQGYSTNSVQELSVAAPLTQQTTSYRGSGADESYFARLNYIYNNKYIAELVMRRDGSSNFGTGNRFGNFPAVSLAWKISDEKFLKNVHVINDLKLRAEYGVSGNMGSGSSSIYSNLYAEATAWGTGFLPANFANPNLKWEQDESGNIGFDLHMFNNRVEVIADAYRKNISNLILISPNSQFLGGNISGGYGGLLTWPVQNVGSMYNQGFGITVNTVDITTKHFQWKTGFNFSIDRNKVTRLVAPINTQYTSDAGNSQAEFLTEVGQPLSMITGYIAQGLFKNYNDITNHAIQTSGGVLTVDPNQGSWVGDIKFKDITNDGVIDNNDRVIIGNPWPKFTYNFNTTFSYSDFDLNLFFTGVYGNQILNLTRYQNELPLGTGPYANHFVTAANFAVPSSLNPADAETAVLTNPGTTIPRPTAADPNGDARLTQWSVESGSYLKLKNVRLSYRVPAAYLAKTHVIKTVVATVQMQNVFTITKYTGYDPEVGMFSYKGVSNIVGMDDGRYPSTRSLTLSLAIDF